MTEIDLKQHLFDSYGGFADKRYKDISRDAPFIVDDRGEGDYDARGNLFLWFCQMFVTVEAVDQVRLTMRGGIPHGSEVARWLNEHDAESGHGGVEVAITPVNVDHLVNFAATFRAIIRGRYDTKAYKYVVPRVEDSLLRLHTVLQNFWN